MRKCAIVHPEEYRHSGERADDKPWKERPWRRTCNTLGVVKTLLSLVKIEHTLFALPLALTGTVLAQRGVPDLRTFLLVMFAFGGARAAAMAFNRLVDRYFDSLNPRTAEREIPTGKVSVGQAWAFVLTSCAVYFLAAWGLNETCLYLSPLGLAVLLGYS